MRQPFLAKEKGLHVHYEAEWPVLAGCMLLPVEDRLERQTASDEWRAKIPTWDWHATCAEIERRARNKPRADRVRVLT
jgi:hypothetical protein